MSKAKKIQLGTAIGLAIILYVVLGNSHIEIFPGTVTEMDYMTEIETTTNELISLLNHNRYENGYEFTFMGYVVAFLVIILAPIGIGHWAGNKFGK